MQFIVVRTENIFSGMENVEFNGFCIVEVIDDSVSPVRGFDDEMAPVVE